MNKRWLAISTGFALFAMFFGSGNLVFPLTVGLESQGHYVMSSVGFLLTGVIVPFLGVFGMMLYRGDVNAFFSCMGRVGIFWFSFIVLGLMGPFGVLARCLTVAHGALQLLLPQVSLPVASLVMCGLIFVLTVNKNKIVSRLGTFLTPVLLVAIAVIAFFGLKNGGTAAPEMSFSAYEAAKNGFFRGYQLMDLMAAFFFSAVVIKHLERVSASAVDDPSFFKMFLRASLVGAAILSLVYVALVMLGWIYAPVLQGVPPQEMLGKIAMETLGSFAAPCVCMAVVLACLTTAIVLTSLFADFLRYDVSKGKLGNSPALLITLCIGFLVSTLEFSGIARFLGPILETAYPALITLTVYNIAVKMKESLLKAEKKT